jgi:hypothetical protein
MQRFYKGSGADAPKTLQLPPVPQVLTSLGTAGRSQRRLEDRPVWGEAASTRRVDGPGVPGEIARTRRDARPPRPPTFSLALPRRLRPALHESGQRTNR